MVTSIAKGGTQKSPLRLSKPTDMIIYWKALEEHFLTVTLWGQKDSGGGAGKMPQQNLHEKLFFSGMSAPPSFVYFMACSKQFLLALYSSI
jgi:hypothetical protein